MAAEKKETQNDAENVNILDVKATITISRAYKLPLAKLSVSGSMNKAVLGSKANKICERAIIFVIDRSYSMCGERISMVKNVLTPFIQEMCNDDNTIIKLVLFNSGIEIIEIPQTGSQQSIHNLIETKVYASGGTNFYEASKGLVNETASILKQYPSYQLTVIMCSDGEVSKDNAKQGHNHWKEFVNTSYTKVHGTVPYVETIGISTSHDADVLDGFIINDQVGNYCKCNKAEEINTAFERAQNETMSRKTATKLCIEFPLNVYNDIYNSNNKDTKFHLYDLIVTTDDFASNFWISLDALDNTTSGGDTLQLIINDKSIPIVIKEVTDNEECQYEAIDFYNQVLKDMLYTLKNITNPQRLKMKAQEIENELNNEYAAIFKMVTAEPAEKIKLQNEIKQLLSIGVGDDDNKSTDDGNDDISKRRAKLMKQYKKMNKNWKKYHAVIKIFNNTLSSLKALVREIILGRIRIQEIRQHILDLHFRKKHAKRMEKLILSDEQLAKRQEMYDKIIIPTEKECENISNEVGSGCYLSTLSFQEVALEGDSLWICGRIDRSGGAAVSNPELIKIEYISSDSYFRMALEAASNDNDNDNDEKIGFADSSRQCINSRLFPIYGNIQHFKASYPYIQEILSHTLSGRNDIHIVDYNALWTILGYMICNNDLTTKNIRRILYEMKQSLKLLSDNIKCKPFKENSYAREPDTNATYLISLAEKKRLRISCFIKTFKARTTSWVSEINTLFADRLMNIDIDFNHEFYLSAIMHRLRIMFNLQLPKNMDDAMRKRKVEGNHKKLLQILICGDGNDIDNDKEEEKAINDGLEFNENVYTKKIFKQKKLIQIAETLKFDGIKFDKTDDQIVEDWNVNQLKPSTKKLLIAILSRIDIRDLIKGESFFDTLSNMNCNETNIDKFCKEFIKKCKYRDINKIPNNLNLLFNEIGWKTNINVLRAICCVSILFQKNKAYHDNVAWFGDDVKKQIINDPQSVLKRIYLKFVIKNMRFEYKMYIERKNMEKLREIHTNPILPDDIDEYGNLPYLRCGWKQCGKVFANRDQLLCHVRYALYGDKRPLLHGFHLHCNQIISNNPNITLSNFKKKVRNSFNGTKYAQYIQLAMYDIKMEHYYKQFG